MIRQTSVHVDCQNILRLMFINKSIHITLPHLQLEKIFLVHVPDVNVQTHEINNCLNFLANFKIVIAITLPRHQIRHGYCQVKLVRFDYFHSVAHD
ncbi:hypothetical protein BB779_18790 [Pseudomonas viridiflava]|nr:hypothetical protein BB779_18790 [Pseudomonas viridiflava]